MTIFSIQRFLEDHLERRGLQDVDGYAVKVANSFERLSASAGQNAIAKSLSRIRTVFFRRNADLDRRQFESSLATRLCARFQKKKVNDVAYDSFRKALRPVRLRLSRHRHSIGSLMVEFKRVTEARGIDPMWESRKGNRLRRKPEVIAQGLLAMFASGVIRGRGHVIREFSSGVGFVDVGISFGGTLHLIELKVTKGAMTGVNQLAKYMATEGRDIGWLVLIDVRSPARWTQAPKQIKVSSGIVHVIQVNVNPIPPNQLN